MLAVIDRVAQETGRTRNEIVVLSMEFALENLEIESKRGVRKMAILKCKMCGVDILLSEDKTTGVCDHCGSTMTFPGIGRTEAEPVQPGQWDI